MQITTIPRYAITTALDAMRLPLSTVERLAGQASNEAWPPALLFDQFQAEAKKFAGAFLRDDTLVTQGRAQADKVAQLRRAMELKAQAETVRTQADAEFQRKQEAAAREREAAANEAAEREAKIAREKRAAEQRVKAQARKAAETVAKVEEAREERLAGADRKARLSKADAEAAALAKQQEAVNSIATVEVLADAVEKKKTQRKAG